MLLDNDGVRKVLPHREPFIFIDTCESVELPPEREGKKLVYTKELPGTKIKCNFEVKEDLEILRGHFPGNPILPGVIQTEIMAQGAAFACMAFNYDITGEGGLETLLLGVDKARFRKQLIPGMKLDIFTEVTKVRGTVAVYTCRIEHEGEKVSECEILATLVMK